MKELLKKLDSRKIEINQNRNPIEMDLFLSFLKVKTERLPTPKYSFNWTNHENEEHNLKINGGIVGETEYLHNIQYGKNLDNKYNNYVNPFYLSPIMTNEGVAFFVEYYRKDIEEIKTKSINEIKYLQEKIDKQNLILNQINTLKLEGIIL